MLILERKLNEGMYFETLNGPIYVKLLSVNRNSGKTKLGIDAPQDVNIRREELPPREGGRKGNA